MVEVHGFCDERFRELEALYRSDVEADGGRGSSLAATLHGVAVVDLWGGTRDAEMTLPWEADTVVRVFSTSKVPVIVAVLMLVDRGLLDLDAPIAKYWPEFARNGKGAVTSRQVLVHRSGLPGFGRPFSSVEMADWGLAISALEDAALWYEPGTTSCYHAHTFGFLLGELIQRVAGTPFVDFVCGEVLAPLGADFHFTLPSPVDQARVAALWPPAVMPPIDSPMANAVLDELTTRNDAGTTASLTRLHPGGCGLTNAGALARLGAMLAMGGELDGHRYLGRATVEEAASEQSFAIDEMFGPCRYGLGFGLHSDEFPAPTPGAFHWGGVGGSFVTMDMVSEVSCAFTPSLMQVVMDRGAEPRQKALWATLGDICGRLT